jgi:hypothetical protein
VSIKHNQKSKIYADTGTFFGKINFIDEAYTWSVRTLDKARFLKEIMSGSSGVPTLIKSIVWLPILSVSSEHPDTRLPAEGCDALDGKIDITPTTLSDNSRPSLGAEVGSAPTSALAA